MPQSPENSKHARITDVSVFSGSKTSISPKLGHINNGTENITMSWLRSL